jgi:hypothetical protein
MTDIKIQGQLTAGASEALAEHARALYDKPGSTRLGVIELRSDWNKAPAPGSETKPVVNLRIAGLEIAGRDQEGALREAQRTLYLQRTARGTLDEDGQLQLSQDTLKLTAGILADIETARLRAALNHWTLEINKVVHSAILTDGEIRHELDRIARGLTVALHPARDEAVDGEGE